MYYHGTAIDLPVGAILQPGSKVGHSWYGRSEHVYMTQPLFSLTEVGEIPKGIRTAHQYAVYSATLWGCWAADGFCKECEWNRDHAAAFLGHRQVPNCVKVYEVKPLGPVLWDDAYDVTPDAVRTTEAQIVRVLSEGDIATLLEW